MCEIKYCTENGAATFDGFNSYNALLIPDFPVGANKNQRLGNHIRYKFFQLRFTVGQSLPAAPVAGTSEYSLVRIIIWVPRQQFLAVANPINQTQLLNTASTLSSINNNGARVLYDKTLYMSKYSAQLDPFGTFNPAIFIKKKFRLFNNVNFKTTAEVTPSDPKDQIYLTIISNVPAANHVSIAVGWNSRISFYDM